MKIFLLIIITISIVAIDIPKLYKSKCYKEMLVHLSLLLTGNLLFIGLVLSWKIPSPLLLIEKIFGPLSKIVLNYLS